MENQLYKQILEQENTKLTQTIDKLTDFKNEINQNLTNLFKYEKNPDTIKIFSDMYTRILSNLNKNCESPYFAKIQYKDDNEPKAETLYIGKVGFTSLDGENEYVIDWRAPISQVYYNGKLGRVSYKTLDKTFYGDLSLKRQFDIADRQIVKYFDNDDLISNDEFLKPYLTTSADNRLKSIVSTIQGEQDQIIRQPLFKNIIVQGVAGSGKTTVALHRLSYLVYTYEKKVKTSEYLILAPNKIFLNYISSILPDLDVGSTNESTIEELVIDLSEIPAQFRNKHELYNDLVKNKEDYSFLKYKSSLKFKEDLDRFIEYYIDNKILKELTINNIPLLSKNEVLSLYNEINASIPIDQRINNLCKKLDSMLSSSEFIRKINNAYQLDPNKSLAEKNQLLNSIEKGYFSQLKKYFCKSKFNILKLYETFVGSCEKFCDKNFAKDIKKHTSKSIKSKKLGYEDLGAILYLTYRFVSNKFSFKQLVIDEAQDLGELLFYTLHKLFPDANFSIYGDLTQGIYEFQSVDSWNSVIMNCFNNNAELIEMNKSYRTTIEIMEEANKVSTKLGFSKAENVLRHGNPVTRKNITDSKTDITNCIADLQLKGCKSIAIICKDEQELSHYKELLKEENIVAYNENDIEFNNEPCILTAQTSKGLEFDGVVIVNEKSYDTNISQEAKSLYVAMTRALHELIILS